MSRVLRQLSTGESPVLSQEALRKGLLALLFQLDDLTLVGLGGEDVLVLQFSVNPLIFVVLWTRLDCASVGACFLCVAFFWANLGCICIFTGSVFCALFGTCRISTSKDVFYEPTFFSFKALVLCAFPRWFLLLGV